MTGFNISTSFGFCDQPYDNFFREEIKDATHVDSDSDVQMNFPIGQYPESVVMTERIASGSITATWCREEWASVDAKCKSSRGCRGGKAQSTNGSSLSRVQT